MSWPYPGDSPTARARRVAHAYRAELEAHNPKACGWLDERMRSWGQHWVVPRLVTLTPDRLLTAAEAADVLCIDPGSVYTLVARQRLTGIRTEAGWRFRAGDVLALAENRRTRRKVQR